MKNSHKNQSLKNILGAIVMAILFICIILVLAASFIFKSKNSTPSIFGYNIYIMNGTGMEPRIPDKSAVFVKKDSFPKDDSAIGRVALCNIVDNELTTVLGVYGIENVDGVTNYIMKSDTNPDTKMISVPEDKIIGEAVKYDELLGKLILFATSKIGIIVLVILPAAIIIILYLLSVLRKVKNDESEYEMPLEEQIEQNIEEESEEEEDEIIEETPSPVQVVVDARGEAQYNDNKQPTKPAEALDDFLFKPKANDKQPSKPLKPKSFEFKASAEDIKQIKKPEFDKENNVNKQMDMFIPPRKTGTKQKKSSNQTLEELMKMLDKKEKEIKK